LAFLGVTKKFVHDFFDTVANVNIGFILISPAAYRFGIARQYLKFAKRSIFPINMTQKDRDYTLQWHL